MKSLVNKSVLLEVSQRELEQIAFACEYTKQYWYERAESTLESDETMKFLRRELGDEYEMIGLQAREILNNLPF